MRSWNGFSEPRSSHLSWSSRIRCCMAIAILTQAMLSSLLPRLAGSPKKAYPSASGGAIRGGGAGEVSLAPKAAMTDVPGSLIAFQQRFPDEAACAAYLAAV